MIRLHLNELRPAPRDLWAAVVAQLADLDPSRYPDPEEEAAVRADLAAYAGWDPDRVLMAPGSDVLLYAAVLAVRLRLGGRLVLPWPTFSRYPAAASAYGVPVERVPLGPDFQLAVTDLVRRVGPRDAVVLVRPNNPTGNLFPAEAVEAALAAGAGLVVVDEAYAELAGETLVPRLRDARRVVVLRTLSKGFGLAGLRFGYALASPDWAEPLAGLLPPYLVSRPTLRAVRVALAAADRLPALAADLARRREALRAALARLPGLRPYPSAANFVLVRVSPPAPAAPELAARLAEAGVAVRTFEPETGIADCIRITVGTDDDHAALLAALRRALGCGPVAAAGGESR